MYCEVLMYMKVQGYIYLSVDLEVVAGQQLQIRQMVDDLIVNLFTVQSIQPLEQMQIKSVLQYYTVYTVMCSVSYQHTALLIQRTSRWEKNCCSTGHLKFNRK